MSKPIKNRVMCPECNRHKMLFDTESKANNFIKFNGNDFEHQNELRVYFCPSCGGYHISSKEYKSSYSNSTDRLINAYKQDINNISIIDIINCYNLLKCLNIRNRKQINKELKTEMFSMFNDKIKEEAKVKYYKEFGL